MSRTTRIKPTDPYVIQVLDCDGNWVDWYPGSGGTSLSDMTAAMRQSATEIARGVLGIPRPDQPTEAPSGDCANYSVFVPGNGQVIVPVHVAAGDTITVSSATGIIIYDPGVLGAVYSYSHPEGISATADGTFPLAGVNEIRLIMNLNGVWYDAYNITAFTVPAGVDQAFFTLMCNDNDLSNNSGGWAVNLEVCNNHATLWTKDWNFKDAAATWHSGGSDTNSAAWTTGIGWHGDVHGDEMRISQNLPTDADITYVKVFYECTTPDNHCNFAHALIELGTYAGDIINNSCNVVPPSGSIEVVMTITAPAHSDGLSLAFYNISSTAIAITRIIIQGTGTQPDWAA